MMQSSACDILARFYIKGKFACPTDRIIVDEGRLLGWIFVSNLQIEAKNSVFGSAATLGECNYLDLLISQDSAKPIEYNNWKDAFDLRERRGYWWQNQIHHK